MRPPLSNGQVDSSSEAFQAAAQGAFDNFYRGEAKPHGGCGIFLLRLVLGSVLKCVDHHRMFQH